VDGYITISMLLVVLHLYLLYNIDVLSWMGGFK
jgi:hypothetical protein